MLICIIKSGIGHSGGYLMVYKVDEREGVYVNKKCYALYSKPNAWWPFGWKYEDLYFSNGQIQGTLKVKKTNPLYE